MFLALKFETGVFDSSESISSAPSRARMVLLLVRFTKSGASDMDSFKRWVAGGRVGSFFNLYYLIDTFEYLKTRSRSLLFSRSPECLETIRAAIAYYERSKIIDTKTFIQVYMLTKILHSIEGYSDGKLTRRNKKTLQPSG